MNKTPAKLTVKVASTNNAAKDDAFDLSEEGAIDNAFVLNVLANDPGSAVLYSLDQTGVNPSVKSATLNDGGTITIVGGNVEYTNPHLQNLALGQTHQVTFQYTAQMANGVLSTSSVSITIAGTNDTPVLAEVAAVSIEDTESDDAPEAIKGTLVGSDVDNGAVLRYGFADDTSFVPGQDDNLVSTNEFGTLVLNKVTGNYTFTADAGRIDQLKAGDNPVVNFNVRVGDEHGAESNTVTLTFNFTGANDTATIAGDDAGTVTEDIATSVSGTLTASDLDAGEAGFKPVSELDGEYGYFTFENGQWTYTLHTPQTDEAAYNKVQALGEGVQVTETLTVESLDGTATKDIAVTITGQNDVAVFTGDKAASIDEDALEAVYGTVAVSDVDAGETGFKPLSDADLTGQYGNFAFDADTGAWTYTLDNAKVQSLSSGQTLVDKLIVTSLDGSTESINVTINGADEPVVTPPTSDDPSLVFKVNRGAGVTGEQGAIITQVSDKVYVIENFTANDTLAYVKQLSAGSELVGDYYGDSQTDTKFIFNDVQKGEKVEVILLGYSSFDDTQLVQA